MDYRLWTLDDRLWTILAWLFVSPFAVAEDHWSQWRGPNANGTSLTADPPVTWSADKNVKWKTELPGQGSSTPVIWQQKLFVLTAIPTGRKAAPETIPTNLRPGEFGTGPQPDQYYQFVVLCYDRTTGKEIWRRVATEQVPHEAGHLTNTFASSSPVTDGQSLFVSFGSRGVFCFDLDGHLKWSRDLGRMETRRDFGEAASPALHDGVLVVPWDHEEQSYYFGLDADSGQTLWQTPRDELTTWATPLIVDHKGRSQVITNGSVVRSYDLHSGELIWQCGGQVSNPIPCPVAKDGVVYCMTGYRGNSVYAISLDAEGDVTEDPSVVRWHRHDAAPYIASPVLYEDRLYLTKSSSSIVSSLDLETGQPIIQQQRLEGMRTVYASPVAAAGRIYFSSREGVTVVIRHADQMEVLATNQLGETLDASPAMIGNELYLRGSKHLYCVEK